MSAATQTLNTTPEAADDNVMLKLLNVESAYGPIKAIRGVSLQVRRGEIATVLAPMAAGKTTILKNHQRHPSTRARARSSSRAKASPHKTLLLLCKAA